MWGNNSAKSQRPSGDHSEKWTINLKYESCPLTGEGKEHGVAKETKLQDETEGPSLLKNIWWETTRVESQTSIQILQAQFGWLFEQEEHFNCARDQLRHSLPLKVQEESVLQKT